MAEPTHVPHDKWWRLTSRDTKWLLLASVVVFVGVVFGAVRATQTVSGVRAVQSFEHTTECARQISGDLQTVRDAAAQADRRAQEASRDALVALANTQTVDASIIARLEKANRQSEALDSIISDLPNPQTIVQNGWEPSAATRALVSTLPKRVDACPTV